MNAKCHGEGFQSAMSHFESKCASVSHPRSDSSGHNDRMILSNPAHKYLLVIASL